MKFQKIVLSILLGCVMVLSAPLHAESNNSFPLDTVIWQYLDIPVCWENINEDANLRGQVQNAIQATWETNSQLDFFGWGQCPTGFFNGIRIAVQDVHPHTKGLGNNLINIQDGMVLNFTMKNYNQRCPNAFSVTNCITWVAIHEFGHALGFTHEQNRNDTPDTCTKDAQGTSGNVIFTEWDVNSIMNYCNPSYNGFGNLSAIDILTVQTYYGRIPTFSPDSITRTLQIPVVQVGSLRYSASLSDPDGDGRYTLGTTSSTTNQSSKPAIYNTISSILNLPLIKVIDGENHVTSLYSAVVQRQSNGEFTLTSDSLIQPVPTDN